MWLYYCLNKGGVFFPFLYVLPLKTVKENMLFFFFFFFFLQDVIYQYEDVPQVLLDFLHVRHFHTGNKSSME